MNVKKIFSNLFKKGFRIGLSTGKTFDPYSQERTSAMDDFLNSKKKNAKNKKEGGR